MIPILFSREILIFFLSFLYQLCEYDERGGLDCGIFGGVGTLKEGGRSMIRLGSTDKGET